MVFLLTVVAGWFNPGKMKWSHQACSINTGISTTTVVGSHVAKYVSVCLLFFPCIHMYIDTASVYLCMDISHSCLPAEWWTTCAMTMMGPSLSWLVYMELFADEGTYPRSTWHFRLPMKPCRLRSCARQNTLVLPSWQINESLFDNFCCPQSHEILNQEFSLQGCVSNEVTNVSNAKISLDFFHHVFTFFRWLVLMSRFDVLLQHRSTASDYDILRIPQVDWVLRIFPTGGTEEPGFGDVSFLGCG